MDIFLERIDKILARIIEPILVVVGLLMALGFVLGIVFRVGFNTPIFGLEELILFGVMWFYMLGAVLASRNREHLSADLVDVVSDSETVRWGFTLVSTIISILICLFFLYCAFDLFTWGLQRGQVTPIFSLPWVFAQSSLLFAAVFFLLYLLRDLIHLIRGEQLPNEDTSR